MTPPTSNCTSFLALLQRGIGNKILKPDVYSLSTDTLSVMVLTLNWLVKIEPPLLFPHLNWLLDQGFNIP